MNTLNCVRDSHSDVGLCALVVLFGMTGGRIKLIAMTPDIGKELGQIHSKILFAGRCDVASYFHCLGLHGHHLRYGVSDDRQCGSVFPRRHNGC